ncbi:acyltransferase family protein [Terricaulis sp.]|uniref:acyltransferase family protein n=1 Tax=Terricaulis sp. TaxID=2768686 RepID=UPI002AC4C2C4|nr:acyltransferase family protein [Terricaulis sp.]MDZ4693285.1 acyltransferase family protein [Terricaulis sp.]
MHADTPSAATRRADVDHLRVVALTLLIVYHILLIYTGREFWRVSSVHHGYWADYLLNVLTPWRMSLVFLIGGIAVRFMLSRPSFGAFVQERAARLLTAFVFAVVVLVPPQRFVRLDELGANAQQDYLSYMLHEAPFAVSYMGAHVPQFAHAWFLPYLFAYSVLIGVFWWGAPRAFAAVQRAISRVHVGVWIAATMLWFAFLETAGPQNPQGDHLFFTDFQAHLKFLPLFIFGVMIGKSEKFSGQLDAIKLPLWCAAGSLMLLSGGLEWLFLHNQLSALPWLIARGFYGATMLFGVLAFGHWALNRPTIASRYAADAILPIYLMHQPALIITADLIVSRAWPLPLEMAVLLSATTILPLAAYHLFVRHTPWLRFLFGLRPQLRAPTPTDPDADAPANDAGAPTDRKRPSFLAPWRRRA